MGALGLTGADHDRPHGAPVNQHHATVGEMELFDLAAEQGVKQPGEQLGRVVAGGQGVRRAVDDEGYHGGRVARMFERGNEVTAIAPPDGFVTISGCCWCGEHCTHLSQESYPEVDRYPATFPVVTTIRAQPCGHEVLGDLVTTTIVIGGEGPPRGPIVTMWPPWAVAPHMHPMPQAG